MNLTGLTNEVKQMTGQHQAWVADKRPIGFTPARSHWRTPKSLLHRLFRKGRIK